MWLPQKQQTFGFKSCFLMSTVLFVCKISKIHSFQLVFKANLLYLLFYSFHFFIYRCFNWRMNKIRKNGNEKKGGKKYRQRFCPKLQSRGISSFLWDDWTQWWNHEFWIVVCGRQRHNLIFTITSFIFTSSYMSVSEKVSYKISEDKYDAYISELKKISQEEKK